MLTENQPSVYLKSLDDLPEEVILKISDFFSTPKEIINLLQANRAIFQVFMGKTHQKFIFSESIGCSNVVFITELEKLVTIKAERNHFPYIKRLKIKIFNILIEKNPLSIYLVSLFTRNTLPNLLSASLTIFNNTKYQDDQNPGNARINVLEQHFELLFWIFSKAKDTKIQDIKVSFPKNYYKKLKRKNYIFKEKKLSLQNPLKRIKRLKMDGQSFQLIQFFISSLTFPNLKTLDINMSIGDLIIWKENKDTKTLINAISMHESVKHFIFEGVYDFFLPDSFTKNLTSFQLKGLIDREDIFKGYNNLQKINLEILNNICPKFSNMQSLKEFSILFITKETDKKTKKMDDYVVSLYLQVALEIQDYSMNFNRLKIDTDYHKIHLSGKLHSLISENLKIRNDAFVNFGICCSNYSRYDEYQYFCRQCKKQGKYFLHFCCSKCMFCRSCQKFFSSSTQDAFWIIKDVRDVKNTTVTLVITFLFLSLKMGSQ